MMDLEHQQQNFDSLFWGPFGIFETWLKTKILTIKNLILSIKTDFDTFPILGCVKIDYRC